MGCKYGMNATNYAAQLVSM